MAEIPDRNGETETSFAGKGMAFVIVIAIIVLSIFLFMVIRYSSNPDASSPSNTANSSQNNSRALP